MKDKIQADLKEAMKARESHRVLTLRGLMSEIKQFEVDNRQEVGPEQSLKIVQKEIKKRRDALKFAEEANRDDLVEQNKLELELLGAYLPKQLGAEELTAIVDRLIADGANSIGMLMGALNKDYRGQFDGKAASELIKQRLS